MIKNITLSLKNNRQVEESFILVVKYYSGNNYFNSFESSVEILLSLNDFSLFCDIS